MFIFNLKLNKKKIAAFFITISLLIILIIFIYSVYIIFFKHNSSIIKSDSIFELNENNYTTILKAANENIDSYIGLKVKITGYIYRLIDFEQNQFVIARDMKFNENNQSLVVGFLCNYNKASNYQDGTWVEAIGEIKKGNFNGDIAILDIISIKQIHEPQNIFVSPPDNNLNDLDNLGQMLHNISICSKNTITLPK